MSSFAREKDRARGIASSRYLPRWRLLLSTALAKAISKVIEDALVADRSTPDPVLNHGKPRHPPPPPRPSPGPSASGRPVTSLPVTSSNSASVPLAAGVVSPVPVPLAGIRHRRRRSAAFGSAV